MDSLTFFHQEQVHRHVYPTHVPMAENAYQTLDKKPTSAGVHKASKGPTAKNVSYQIMQESPICIIYSCRVAIW